MSQPGPDLPRAEDRIIEGTNQFRQREGRGRLRSNARLAKTAREFAQYLARTGKFSHTADGRQPQERTAAQGYAEAIVAENLGWELNSAGFTTEGLADALVEGWKNSPHHRQNMLDPDVTEIGVGVAHSAGTGRYYGVQVFGRPRSEETAFTVVNETDTPVRYAVDGKEHSVPAYTTVTHRQGRPPQLSFRRPGGEGPPLRPRNGSRYVIRRDAAGRYTLVEE
jgi:hypothetical protein